jgi:hypothetical protein
LGVEPADIEKAGEFCRQQIVNRVRLRSGRGAWKRTRRVCVGRW